jgi:hypothetical protein
MGLTRGVRESDLGLPKAVPSICIFILFSALLSACRADVQSIDPGLQGEYGSTPELTRHPTGTPCFFYFLVIFIYIYLIITHIFGCFHYFVSYFDEDDCLFVLF